MQATFLAHQAYWRDILAFTWHHRTLNDGPHIAPALLALAAQRGFGGRFVVDAASAKHVSVSPTLRWVEAQFVFETGSPAATCAGRVVLLPEAGADGVVSWKIWGLSTWVETLKGFEENVEGLRAPGRSLEAETIETDVFILGGGNA